MPCVQLPFGRYEPEVLSAIQPVVPERKLLPLMTVPAPACTYEGRWLAHWPLESSITPEGKLFHMVREEAFHGEEVVIFLRHLLSHLTGTLLILWDGSPIHRSQVVKQFLREGGAERIHLEQLPGYARDLN